MVISKYTKAFMPTLIIRNGTGDVVHELNANSVTIGRHPDNSLVIEDLSVSTHHASIVVDDNRYILRDLNSTNGTMVNGRPITEKELRREDIIKFGQVEAVFRISTQKPSNKKNPDKVEAQLSKPLSRLASKVANVGKTAFTESKRLARLAALKARLTKAKHITLPTCYYAIGRKCYETRCFASVISAEFKEIEDLKQLVQDKRRKAVVADHATALEKLITAAKNSVGVATSEASALGFKKLFTQLGEKAAQQEHAPEIADELDELRQTITEINNLEAEYGNVASDHSSQKSLNLAAFNVFRYASLRNAAIFLTVIGSVCLCCIFGQSWLSSYLIKRHIDGKNISLGSNKNAFNLPSDAKEIDKCLLSAKNGNIVDQGIIGLMYIRGLPDGKKDLKEGIRWLNMSIENGCARSATVLGIMYLKGLAVPTDKNEGLRLLRLAATKNDPPALDILNEENEQVSTNRTSEIKHPEVANGAPAAFTSLGPHDRKEYLLAMRYAKNINAGQLSKDLKNNDPTACFYTATQYMTMYAKGELKCNNGGSTLLLAISHYMIAGNGGIGVAELESGWITLWLGDEGNKGMDSIRSAAQKGSEMAKEALDRLTPLSFSERKAWASKEMEDQLKELKAGD
ncbi:MAG: FHA domain-containing protein [bacterium]